MTRSRDLADTQKNIGGSVPPFAAGKNKIINGDFNINQRAFTSITGSSSNQYCFDRFFVNSSGGTTTVTPQTFTVGAGPASGYEAKNFLQIVTSSQSATNHYAYIAQPIESVRTLAGQTATISFFAKVSSGTASSWAETVQDFGSGGSSAVVTAFGTASLTTSWQRFSFTATVPSISGKTIGTSDAIQVALWVSAGSAIRTGYGVQNGTFQIWGVQIEAGSVATPFQTATGIFQGELAACQRYYFRFNSNANEVLIPAGFANSTTTASGRIQYPVPMRVAPTSLDSANLRFGNYAGSNFDMSSVAYNQVSNIGAQVYGTVTGATAGHVGAIIGSASNAYVGLSAEL